MIVSIGSTRTKNRKRTIDLKNTIKQKTQVNKISTRHTAGGESCDRPPRSRESGTPSLTAASYETRLSDICMMSSPELRTLPGQGSTSMAGVSGGVTARSARSADSLSDPHSCLLWPACRYWWRSECDAMSVACCISELFASNIGRYNSKQTILSRNFELCFVSKDILSVQVNKNK